MPTGTALPTTASKYESSTKLLHIFLRGRTLPQKSRQLGQLHGIEHLRQEISASFGLGKWGIWARHSIKTAEYTSVGPASHRILQVDSVDSPYSTANPSQVTHPEPDIHLNAIVFVRVQQLNEFHHVDR